MPGFAKVEVRCIRRVGQSNYIAIPVAMMRELRWRINEPVRIEINGDTLAMRAVEEPGHKRTVIK